MGSFLKVLFNNLLEGPSTDPYPVGPTFTPERLRGKCVIDPELCVGCGVCKNVCAASAIDIRQKDDCSGYTITVWRNSCCLCASCRHYCPTGAMTLTNDWHSAQPQSEKYDCLERHDIPYLECADCGTKFRPVPLKLLQKLYAFNQDLDAEKLRMLCPKCRQIEDAKRTAKFREKQAAKAVTDKAASGMEINLEKVAEKKEAAKTASPAPDASQKTESGLSENQKQN